MAEFDKYIDYLHFSSHKDLINELLFGDLKRQLHGYVFRGHGLQEYELIPSVLRKERQVEIQTKIFGNKATDVYYQKKPELESFQQNLEFNILYEFYRLCDLHGLKVPECKEFIKTNQALTNLKLFSNNLNPNRTPTDWLPESLWELAALAQHYGLPTRLLDWTRDVFTALFFATIGGLNPKNYNVEKNMTLWALNLEYINYIDHQNKIFPLKTFVPTYSANPNLQAQSGVFTLWQTPNKGINSDLAVDRRPLNEQLIGRFKAANQEPFQYPFFYMITFPHAELKKLLLVLDTLNYTESKNFPGYVGVAMRVLNGQYRKTWT